jgi:hypothetical protein
MPHWADNHLIIDSVNLHISEVKAFSVGRFERVQIGSASTPRGCKLTLQIECQGTLSGNRAKDRAESLRSSANSADYVPLSFGGDAVQVNIAELDTAPSGAGQICYRLKLVLKNRSDHARAAAIETKIRSRAALTLLARALARQSARYRSNDKDESMS